MHTLSAPTQVLVSRRSPTTDGSGGPFRRESASFRSPVVRQSARKTVDFHGLGGLNEWRVDRRKPAWEAGLRKEAEGEGFEPSTDLTTRNGFRDRRIRPLCHPSGAGPEGARGGEGGIRTLEGGMNPLNALAGRCLQPLGHFSRFCGHRVSDAERRIPHPEDERRARLHQDRECRPPKPSGKPTPPGPALRTTSGAGPALFRPDSVVDAGEQLT